MSTTHLQKSTLALLTLVLASASVACTPARGTMPQHTWHPDDADASCTADQRDPTFVAGWKERDRTALAAELDDNEVVIVSALGCKVEVLTQCDVEGGYESSGRGRYDLDRKPVNAQELVGDCEWATHVVSGGTVGKDQALVTAELTPLSLDGYNLSGSWQGVMRQPGGPYEVYDLVLDLEQENDRIFGVSHLSTVDGEYWGKLRFEGRLEGNTMFFADVQLIDDNLGPFLAWCDKGGYLVLDPRDATMRGPWRAFGCSPGELDLEQRVMTQ